MFIIYGFQNSVNIFILIFLKESLDDFVGLLKNSVLDMRLAPLIFLICTELDQVISSIRKLDILF